MLEQLLIRNVALFEEARINFGPGFHVLTGETGAGKSLVVDAVSMLCGGKADKDLIRAGSDIAYVEGFFNVENQEELKNILSQQGIALEQDTLILARELNRKGRSTFRVNGMACAQAMYTEITAGLMDLHGQHEHQSLLQESKQLKFIDLLGDQQHESLLRLTRDSFLACSLAKKEYADALATSQARNERQEILTIRQKELKSAKLVAGEEEALQQEKSILRNAEKIRVALQDTGNALSGSGNHEGALSLLDTAKTALEKIAQVDAGIDGMTGRLESLYYELEEVAHEVSQRARDIYQDDTRLEAVETRLDALRKLQRKYGPDSAAMLKVLASIEAELAQFETIEQDLDRLSAQALQCERKYVDASTALSQSRKMLAKLYGQRIETVLQDLNMTGTRFEIHVTSSPDVFRAEGMDQVSMLIAPNAGEEPKPLAKIASGGELSRVMLAMKTLSAEKNQVPTMVFDEIDTGVSGATAMVIAQKLWEIARYRQVICVSHLHQLAAMANVQFHVEKHETEGRTLASIQPLDEQGRVQEIAKMLGDLRTQSESSTQHAKVMLEDARMYRKNHPGTGIMA